MVCQMEELAVATGRTDEAHRYHDIVTRMKQQYHESFYDPAANVYGDGTSTAFACALWLGVTPAELLPQVVSNFERHLASINYTTIGKILLSVLLLSPPHLLRSAAGRFSSALLPHHLLP
jgi:hypothetical protein